MNKKELKMIVHLLKMALIGFIAGVVVGVLIGLTL